LEDLFHCRIDLVPDDSIKPRLKDRILSPRERLLDIQISGMRNVIVHDYFRINHDRVWATIREDIPELKDRIEELLRLVPE
jgi:uncharacterized protein with HEPN domain